MEDDDVSRQLCWAPCCPETWTSRDSCIFGGGMEVFFSFRTVVSSLSRSNMTRVSAAPKRGRPVLRSKAFPQIRHLITSHNVLPRDIYMSLVQIVILCFEANSWANSFTDSSGAKIAKTEAHLRKGFPAAKFSSIPSKLGACLGQGRFALLDLASNNNLLGWCPSLQPAKPWAELLGLERLGHSRVASQTAHWSS